MFRLYRCSGYTGVQDVQDVQAIQVFRLYRCSGYTGVFDNDNQYQKDSDNDNQYQKDSDNDNQYQCIPAGCGQSCKTAKVRYQFQIPISDTNFRYQFIGLKKILDIHKSLLYI